MVTAIRLSDEHEHLSRPYDDSNADRQRLILDANRLATAGLSKRMIARRLNSPPPPLTIIYDPTTRFLDQEGRLSRPRAKIETCHR